MARGHRPGSLLCGCTGSLIGAVSAVLISTSGFSALPFPTEPQLTISSLQPDLLHETADPNTWTSNISGMLRAAMGLAVETVSIRKGDTLADVLSSAGVDGRTTFNVVQAMHDVFNPRYLREGQELELAYNALGANGEPLALSGLSMEVAPGHLVSVKLQEDGSFSASEIMAETHSEYARATGTISSSLYEAAVSQGVPLDVLSDMVRLFSYDVDFQRDIQAGDGFALMYEQEVTEDGRPVRTNAIHIAELVLRGKPMKFYAFQHEDGTYDYYNEKGEGVRKALLRTPVNGARLTSSFGSRKHPILGYTRMHKGVDFGAATGTPIMAAGDGVVEKRGRWGSYGNYVRIRHGSNYSTAYAHLSRYAKGLNVGSRVRQGDIIGYVGATGGATGPHLHFEILRNNAQVNPMTVKFPASKKLEGSQLAKFQNVRDQAERKFASLASPGDVAMIEPKEEEEKVDRN
jgi:murein DD-endopeptidase MepM/ murein hydrolase activator NlpD